MLILYQENNDAQLSGIKISPQGGKEREPHGIYRTKTFYLDE